jgi:hypothetical protein
MQEPAIPPEFEITDVIRAEMQVRIVLLDPQHHATFFGPRTDAQRLIELEMVFDSIKATTKELRARGYWAGITLISLDGQRFWYLPFDLFPTLITGLPQKAVETLMLVKQICAQTDEAAAALILPQNQINLLHLDADGMRGQTYTRERRTAKPT